MPCSANTGAYRQNVSWIRHTFTSKSSSVSNELGFFDHPANRAEDLGVQTEELTRAPNPYIFYGFLRVKDGFPSGKIRVHCQNLPFSPQKSAMQLLDAVFSSKF
jgi:hypothetical protein